MLRRDRRAKADQLAAHLRISATKPDNAIEPLERWPKAPGDREQVRMPPFNGEGLARVHAIVEHPLGLLAEFEGRFGSTEHPEMRRKTGERGGYS